MKTFLTRTLSGFIYIALVISSLMIGPVAFGLLLLVFLLLGLSEIYKISKVSGHHPQRIIQIAVGMLCYTLNLLIIWEYLPPQYLTLNLGLLIIPFIAELFRKEINVLQNLGIYSIGILYLVIPLLALNLLFFQGTDLKSPSKDLLLGFFILLWVNDTFAYLVGMLIGKYKFFERISPQKTWEGTIGGAVAGLVVAYVLSNIFPAISSYHWLGIGLTIVIFGTFGDLIESMIKRTYGLKDSGKIMPGHGGLLDRLDSLLVASPFVLMYVVLFLN